MVPGLKRCPRSEWFGLPPPLLRYGEVLTDVANNRWRIGRSIGVGAFGEIYLASDVLSSLVRDDAKYVVKVEPHTNGPLFVEMNFYLRTTKEEIMEEWKQKKGVKHLGIPRLCSFGSHVIAGRDGSRIRFLVLPRFGKDIQKVLQHSRRFHIKTALTLAYHILISLEYVHDCGYVHSDIKAKNMVLSEEWSSSASVYLLDFGLASRYLYRSGIHKEYRFDGRKAEIGTLEFSSRDAHIGAVSRRSDLESLGYNLLRWLDGRLPWDSELSNPEVVKSLKEWSMTNVKSFINAAFPNNNRPPEMLADYLLYVGSLEFNTRPDYDYCRRLFCKGIRDAGFLDDTKLTFESHAKLAPTSRKRAAGCENLMILKKKKLMTNKHTTTTLSSPIKRRPCTVFNQNSAVTRVMTRKCDVVGAFDNFNWAQVLATHPEKHMQKDNAGVKKKKKKKRRPSKVDTPASPLHSNRCSDGGAKQNQNSLSATGGVNEDDSLSNPTPAMLSVMKMKNARKNSLKITCHSMTDAVEGVVLTPAMAKVIANRRVVSSAPAALTRPRRHNTSMPRRYSHF